MSSQDERNKRKTLKHAERLAAGRRHTMAQIADIVDKSESWLHNNGIRAATTQKTHTPEADLPTGTQAGTEQDLADWRRAFEGDPGTGQGSTPAASPVSETEGGASSTPGSDTLPAGDTSGLPNGPGATTEPPPTLSIPGVRDGPGGMLHNDHSDFSRALDDARQRFRVEDLEIVRDYHMCEALRAWFTKYPPGTLFHDSYNNHKHRPVTRPAGTVVFAGGSSLTVAYQLADRASEDLDLMLLAGPSLPKAAAGRVQGLVVDAAAAACSPDLPPEAHGRGKSRGCVGRRFVTIGDADKYLKIEATVWRPAVPEVQARLDSAVGGVFAPQRTATCQSLIGRAATPETLERYPQLAAFEISALAVPITACNKFLALHKRAMSGPAERLAYRARDVYDLWCISQSPAHAGEVRSVVSAMSEHLAERGPRKEDHPRPAEGFATSPAFDPSTEQYLALNEGYDASLELVWGRKPGSFAEAVAGAQSLDP